MANNNDAIKRFRTKYDSTAEFITEPGSQFTPIYTPIIDENGNIDLKETGQKNHYEEIQSHAESVDINVIMDRYYLEGDAVLHQRPNGQYIDITDMPNNFTEVLQKIIIANRDFENLPENIRKEYKTVEEFVNDIGSEKFNKLFNPEEKKPEEKKPEEKEESSNE